MFPDSFRPNTDRDDRLDKRIAALEQRQTQLENTLDGLCPELEFSLGCLCLHCEEAFMIQSNGEMYCPQCHNRTGMWAPDRPGLLPVSPDRTVIT